MRLFLVLLLLPLLSSCGLLQAPGRLIQSAGRTFGFSHNDALAPNGPVMDPAAQVALKAVEAVGTE
jgi:hypothetical protein